MSESADTYRCRVKEEMTWLGKQPKTVFIGEGLINAGRIYGTLDGVPLKRCVEYPICENLIASSAIGLALVGYRPVVVFQRMDFMLIAADAIINHMALLPKMSGGQFSLPIIIRAIIGSRCQAFDVGPQHNHDFMHVFDRYIDTLDYNPGTTAYEQAYHHNEPILIVEDKDLYETDYPAT